MMLSEHARWGAYEGMATTRSVLRIVPVIWTLAGCGASAGPASTFSPKASPPTKLESTDRLSPAEPEEFSPHCFDNELLAGDSGCGLTRAHCRKIAQTRAGAYASSPVPFRAGKCELFVQPWCFVRRGSDPRFDHKECFKTRTNCERVWQLSGSVPVTECQPEKLSMPDISYRFN